MPTGTIRLPWRIDAGVRPRSGLTSSGSSRLSTEGGASSGGSHTWWAGGPWPIMRWTNTSSMVSSSASSFSSSSVGSGRTSSTSGSTTSTSAAVNSTGWAVMTRPPTARCWPGGRYLPDTYAARKRSITSEPNLR